MEKENYKIELKISNLEESIKRIENRISNLDLEVKEIYTLVKNQIKIESKIEFLIKEIEKQNKSLEGKETHEIELKHLKESIKEIKDDRDKAKYAFIGTFLTFVSSVFYNSFIK